MAKNPYTPKTREEFEAYARAMDDANDRVVKSATARGGKGTPVKTPERTNAKKSGKK